MSGDPTWRQRRGEKRRKRGAALLDGLVAEIEYEDLLRYESEVQRGLVHTDAKNAEMAELRRKFIGAPPPNPGRGVKP